MAEAPKRITLSRAKGWRMPPNTVKVDRSTKWGNPYGVDDMWQPWYRIIDRIERAHACVGHYRRMVEEGFVTVPHTIREYERPDGRGGAEKVTSIGAHTVKEVAAKYLRGKNLACWCKPGEPCHADVLLELANAPEASHDRP